MSETKEVAEEYETARRIVEALHLMNTFDLSAEQHIEREAKLIAAEARLMKARKARDALLKRMVAE